MAREKKEKKEKKQGGLLKEFREFISKGNVLDMAVGVIVASSFGAITTSLVNDVFMPFIGYIFGGVDLSSLDLVLREEVLDAAGEVVQEGVTIGIGTFLSTVIDFIIIAFIVFLIVKTFNRAKNVAEKRKHEEEAKAEEPPAPPEPTKEELLLTEIRDLLKEQNSR